MWADNRNHNAFQQFNSKFHTMKEQSLSSPSMPPSLEIKHLGQNLKPARIPSPPTASPNITHHSRISQWRGVSPQLPARTYTRQQQRYQPHTARGDYWHCRLIGFYWLMAALRIARGSIMSLLPRASRRQHLPPYHHGTHRSSSRVRSPIPHIPNTPWRTEGGTAHAERVRSERAVRCRNATKALSQQERIYKSPHTNDDNDAVESVYRDEMIYLSDIIDDRSTTPRMRPTRRDDVVCGYA